MVQLACVIDWSVLQHLMAMFARDHQDTGTSNKDEEEEEGTITIQEMARRFELVYTYSIVYTA